MIAILLTTFLLIISTVYFVCSYLYFRKGPHPGKAPQFLFGSLLQSGLFHGNTLPKALLEWHQKYGDIFEYFQGRLRFTYVCHPKYVLHMAKNRKYDSSRKANSIFTIIFPYANINQVGKTHAVHANTIYPLLRLNNSLLFLPHMLQCIDKTLEKWRSNKNIPNESLVADFSELSLQIGTSVVFDDTNNKNMKELIKQLTVMLQYFSKVALAPFPVWLTKLWLNVIPEYRYASKYILKYITNTVKNTEDDEQNKDLNEKLNSGKSIIHNLIKEVNSGKLKEVEMIDELKMLLFGSYETTSTTLSWFAIYVAQNKEIQNKIKAELKFHKCLLSDDIYIEKLNELKYLEAAIKETLRFAPITPGVAREVMEDDVLVDFPVKKGDIIGIPFYAMHMDPRFWKSDPAIFTPERFTDFKDGEYKDGVDVAYDTNVFGAFGSGRRGCAGKELALLELKVIICKLMQNCTFHIDKNKPVKQRQGITVIPIDFKINITMD
jgi:cytochrome P450